MNDADYIREIAKQVTSGIPEFVAHKERLLAIAEKLAIAETEEEYDRRKKVETLPHTEWQKGDILRVIAKDRNDPLEVGELVVHGDAAGSCAPYVTPITKTKKWERTMNGQNPEDCRWAMNHEELEFVRRP